MQKNNKTHRENNPMTMYQKFCCSLFLCTGWHTIITIFIIENANGISQNEKEGVFNEKQTKKTAFPAKYVLFDSWFLSPSSLHSVKEIGYHGEDMPLTSICNKNKIRHGRSRYLLSVMVEVVKDKKIIPAKVVYVHNRNKRKEYLCLISTDVDLSKECRSMSYAAYYLLCPCQ